MDTMYILVRPRTSDDRMDDDGDGERGDIIEELSGHSESKITKDFRASPKTSKPLIPRTATFTIRYDEFDRRDVIIYYNVKRLPKSRAVLNRTVSRFFSNSGFNFVHSNNISNYDGNGDNNNNNDDEDDEDDDDDEDNDGGGDERSERFTHKAYGSALIMYAGLKGNFYKRDFLRLRRSLHPVNKRKTFSLKTGVSSGETEALIKMHNSSIEHLEKVQKTLDDQCWKETKKMANTILSQLPADGSDWVQTEDGTLTYSIQFVPKVGLAARIRRLLEISRTTIQLTTETKDTDEGRMMILKFTLNIN